MYPCNIDEERRLKTAIGECKQVPGCMQTAKMAEVERLGTPVPNEDEFSNLSMDEDKKTIRKNLV